MAASEKNQLTARERTSSMQLALVFALRMFGLFVVLPILVPYAWNLPLNGSVGVGQADHQQMSMAIGLAMGAYGLTQAFLYIPYGLISDRLGRKPVITVGLLIFAAGSIWAAHASTVYGLMAARALQGAGAISSVVVAMVADTTRDEVRTRAMAMIGMSIALTFAGSLVVGPILFDQIGMSGIFWLIAILAFLAIGLVWRVPIPANTHVHPITHAQAMHEVLTNKNQWWLNFSVFVLHTVQMAMWVVIPSQLLALHVSHQQSTWLYLCVILLSMGVMVPFIIRAEKHNKMFEVMRLAIVVILVAQLVLLAESNASIYWIALALLLFFSGFNVLEATQPSLLSKLTHPSTKGSASGVYNTIQALGLFAGSMLGAWLSSHWGFRGVFIGSSVLVLVWLVLHQLFVVQLFAAKRS